MPTNLTNNEVNIGDIVFQWTVKEYEEHERDRRWFWIIGGIGLALVVYSLLATNYLFTMIIVLFGIILYLHSAQKPMELPFAITEIGIIIGAKFYRFSELKNYWIVYEPPTVKNLYFSLNGVIKSRVQIPLLDFDPRPIKEYLSRFVEEDLEQEEEPLSDRLGRVFKLH